MDKVDVFCAGFIVGGLFSTILLAVLDANNGSYRDGQIDALTGTVQYELVTHADSTKTWERID